MAAHPYAPSQVSYGQADDTAVVGRRIAAWVIDLVIYLVLATLVSLAFFSGAAQQRDIGSRSGSAYCDQWRSTHNGICLSTSDNGRTTVVTVKNQWGSILVLLGHMALYALVQGLLGASIGKLAVGLRVVGPDGQRCGVAKSFARTVLWILDALTCALPIIGGVMILSTKGHRRLGDMAAGTYVVDKSVLGRPVTVPGLTEAAPAGWGDGSAPAAQGAGPHWDPARDTYIQWDPSREVWLAWDVENARWEPIG